MKHISFFLFSLAGLFSTSNTFSQCPTGQVAVSVDVTTDAYGYEIFWDLTPAGNGCGVGALFTFGNLLEVNCASGGSQVALSGGYGDNITINEDLGCLPIGSCYDINFVDDYGDGGADFVVKMNGIPSNSFQTIFQNISNATFGFCAAIPPVNDAVLVSFLPKYTQIPLSQASNLISPAIIQSAGSGNLTNVKVQVTIVNNGNTVYTNTSPTQTLLSLATSSFQAPAYTPTAVGSYVVTATAQMDETDEVLTNSAMSYTVLITDSVYALDNGVKVDQVGVGAGETGHLGNLFEIVNSIAATSASVFISNDSGNGVGQTFTMTIHNTDASGTPTTLLATTLPATLTAAQDVWYTLKFPASVTLAPGKYVFSLEETVSFQQEMGFSEGWSPLVSWVHSATQLPWSPVENFDFNFVFMIRANLNSNLSLEENTTTQLNVFPNPAHSSVQLDGIEIGSQLSLYDELGKLVSQSKADKTNPIVDVAALKPGIYTLKCTTNSAISLARIVKQ